jgi:hypothetical protein
MVFSPDHWKIAACPVNGPAIVSIGDTVYRAWYGIKNTVPHVSYITSLDGGNTWITPVLLDQNEPLGRVDVVAGRHYTWVSWMGKNEQGETWIKLATINRRTNQCSIENVGQIDPGRRSGFPVMVALDHEVMIAYTMVDGERTNVRILSKKDLH